MASAKGGLWISKVEPLKTLPSSIDIPITDCPLKDMVAKDGAWNLQAFRERLPEEVVKKIVNIPPPHPLLMKVSWQQAYIGRLKKTHGMREKIGRSLFGSIKDHTGFAFSYGLFANKDCLPIRSVSEGALGKTCHV
ncbi:hypothetical protein PVK06_003086 [Gossypium arboreum]|uniref:Uncharacterized protein n=1 Tax=Gossypium arboreum TaxID=29729 RepID=A0ABR0R6T0_GOSAR|nr:hypothetical protein PVK06_003086 [Gossypium arboreum]